MYQTDVLKLNVDDDDDDDFSIMMKMMMMTIKSSNTSAPLSVSSITSSFYSPCRIGELRIDPLHLMQIVKGDQIRDSRLETLRRFPLSAPWFLQGSGFGFQPIPFPNQTAEHYS